MRAAALAGLFLLVAGPVASASTRQVYIEVSQEATELLIEYSRQIGEEISPEDFLNETKLHDEDPARFLFRFGSEFPDLFRSMKIPQAAIATELRTANDSVASYRLHGVGNPIGDVEFPPLIMREGDSLAIRTAGVEIARTSAHPDLMNTFENGTAMAWVGPAIHERLSVEFGPVDLALGPASSQNPGAWVDLANNGGVPVDLAYIVVVFSDSQEPTIVPVAGLQVRDRVDVELPAHTSKGPTTARLFVRDALDRPDVTPSDNEFLLAIHETADGGDTVMLLTVVAASASAATVLYAVLRLRKRP